MTNIRGVRGMEYHPNQIMAGTQLDSQGERLTVEHLVQFCHRFAGKKMPLNRQHDIHPEPLGYAENLRVEPDPKSKGDWSLVGDLHIVPGALSEAFNGISISFVDSIREVPGSPIAIYVPYPHYNDEAFIERLMQDPAIAIGRWVKKGAEPVSVALLATTIFFVLKPAWEDFYKQVVSPAITRFLDERGALLAERGINLEHTQVVEFDGRNVGLRFIPDPGKGNASLSPELLIKGVRAAERCLAEHRGDARPVTRVVLLFDPVGREYFVKRVESEIP
jgi:hypothetical protein